MIYVDAPTWKKSATGRQSYAHMVADSLDELHTFAAKIGVKPHFFHKAKSGWHYDITIAQHPTALANGAQLVDSRIILAKAKACTPSKI